jgi:hypothetical protein
MNFQTRSQLACKRPHRTHHKCTAPIPQVALGKGLLFFSAWNGIIVATAQPLPPDPAALEAKPATIELLGAWIWQSRPGG